eukprot:TRINITY_DN3267_c2_g1_i1.p1 TRINITY_DN3267_c2_g1~~TRINITY_DN3267_c2_g1_i1.p1  ORF type:complete len:408 (+),score=112.20 TRINITY_DN3267_c2_g1_i1:82-1224(+)
MVVAIDIRKGSRVPCKPAVRPPPAPADTDVCRGGDSGAAAASLQPGWWFYRCLPPATAFAEVGMPGTPDPAALGFGMQPGLEAGWSLDQCGGLPAAAAAALRCTQQQPQQQQRSRATPCPETDDEFASIFPIGARVRAKGLKNQVEVNGAVGTVVDCECCDDQEWLVMVEFGEPHGGLAVPADNLELVAGEEDEDAGSASLSSPIGGRSSAAETDSKSVSASGSVGPDSSAVSTPDSRRPQSVYCSPQGSRGWSVKVTSPGDEVFVSPGGVEALGEEMPPACQQWLGDTLLARLQQLLLAPHLCYEVTVSLLALAARDPLAVFPLAADSAHAESMLRWRATLAVQAIAHRRFALMDAPAAAARLHCPSAVFGDVMVVDLS